MSKDPFAIEAEITPGYLLARTYLGVKQGLRRVFIQEGLDLTSEQGVALAFIRQNQGLSQCELADKTIKDRTTITRILDRLEQKGLIRRERDERDRRSYRLFTTEEGYALCDKIVPAVQSFREKVFGNLTRSESETLIAILSKINDRLE